jgi:hypothetical protein
MLKFCKKCGVETDRYPKSGECRPCGQISRRISGAKWRRLNPEKVAAQKIIQDEKRRAAAAALAPQRAAAKALRRQRTEEKRRVYLEANREVFREKSRKWRAENPEKAKSCVDRWQAANRERMTLWARRRTWAKNGWTEELFEATWAKQEGVCAICPRKLSREWRKPDSAFADHDHARVTPRGILCRNCNTAIGLLGDDPEWVRRVARYLEIHRHNG